MKETSPRSARDLEILRSLSRRISPEDPGAHNNLGVVYFNKGLFEESVAEFERALDLDPGLGIAARNLEIALARGRLGERRVAELRARLALERARGARPGGEDDEGRLLSLERHGVFRDGDPDARPEIAQATLAHYNEGLALRRDGDFEGAAAEFEAALEAGEDAFVVRQAQAELALLRGDGAAAGELYTSLLQDEPASPKLWNERGVAAHQRGQLAEAETWYRRALSLDPQYALAGNNLGIALYHLGRATEAERVFDLAIAAGRAPGEVWRNFGLMLTRTQRAEDALDAFRRALGLEPESPTAWTGLGAALMELGRAEEARSALMRAVEADENLAEARYQLAFALSALGDYRGALRETKRAIELDPYYPAPRFRLLIDLQFEEARLLAPELEVTERLAVGEGLRTFEYREGALDDVFGEAAAAPEGAGTAGLEAAQAAAPAGERAEILLTLGQVFLQRGLAGEALERFDAVLADGAVGAEEQRRARLDRVRALLMLERYADAREAGSELVERAPDDVEALRLYGEALRRYGEPSRAADVLATAVELAPDDAGLLADLGGALLEAGQREPAERALLRAIALDGAAVSARVSYARLLEATGRGEAAAAQYRNALDVVPSFGEAALALAELESRAGRYAAARDALVDLLTIDAYHLDALVLLGEVLALMGREEDARTAFRRVLRFEPTNERAVAGLSSSDVGSAIFRPEPIAPLTETAAS